MPADHVFVLVKNLLTGQTWRQRHRDVVDALPDTEEFVTAKVLNESFVVARDNDELLISVYLDHASQLRSNAAADPDYGHAEREVLYGVRLPQSSGSSRSRRFRWHERVWMNLACSESSSSIRRCPQHSMPRSCSRDCLAGSTTARAMRSSRPRLGSTGPG
jgi:hypothetical protein